MESPLKSLRAAAVKRVPVGYGKELRLFDQ